MTSTTHVHPSDLFGFSRLAIDATAGLADLVEAMQHAIAGAPGMPDRPAQGPRAAPRVWFTRPCAR